MHLLMQVSSADKDTSADSLRLAGNSAFGEGRFDEAQQLYTQALAATPPAADRHVLFGNRRDRRASTAHRSLAAQYCLASFLTSTSTTESRAAVRLKLGRATAALQDADEALLHSDDR